MFGGFDSSESHASNKADQSKETGAAAAGGAEAVGPAGVFNIWGAVSAVTSTVTNTFQQTADELVRTVKETDWKAELSTFGREVEEEAHHLGDKAAHIVDHLPLHATAGQDQPGTSASPDHMSIQDVGDTFVKFGKSLITGTKEIIEQVKDVVETEIRTAASETSKGRRSRSMKLSGGQRSGGSTLTSKTKYSRFEAEVNAMQRDSSTYCDEPEDTEDFTRWRAAFDLAGAMRDVERLRKDNAFMAELEARIVPALVEYEDFWVRYFYRLHKLQHKEDSRRQLAAQLSQKEVEEELAWDDDDDDGGDAASAAAAAAAASPAAGSPPAASPERSDSAARARARSTRREQRLAAKAKAPPPEEAAGDSAAAGAAATVAAALATIPAVEAPVESSSAAPGIVGGLSDAAVPTGVAPAAAELEAGAAEDSAPALAAAAKLSVVTSPPAAAAAERRPVARLSHGGDGGSADVQGSAASAAAAAMEELSSSSTPVQVDSHVELDGMSTESASDGSGHRDWLVLRPSSRGTSTGGAAAVAAAPGPAPTRLAEEAAHVTPRATAAKDNADSDGEVVQSPEVAPGPSLAPIATGRSVVAPAQGQAKAKPAAKVVEGGASEDDDDDDSELDVKTPPGADDEEVDEDWGNWD